MALFSPALREKKLYLLPPLAPGCAFSVKEKKCCQLKCNPKEQPGEMLHKYKGYGLCHFDYKFEACYFETLY